MRYWNFIKEKPIVAGVTALVVAALLLVALARLLHAVAPRTTIVIAAFEEPATPAQSEELVMSGKAVADMLGDDIEDILRDASSFEVSR